MTASRELLVLRHAKSDWDAGVGSDFERPLAKRGRGDAERMAGWIAATEILPDHVLCSPARRTRETAARLLEALGLEELDVEYRDELYLASLEDLLAALAGCPQESRRVLVVGHNPGMERLVRFLDGGRMEEPPEGKFFPTAALAHFGMPPQWSRLEYGAGRLMHHARPRFLPE